MAVYRIFPEKDAFVTSEPTSAGLYPNAGLDPILEVGGYPDVNLTGRSNRTLIQFSTSDINDAINNKVSGSYQAYLNLYLAEADCLPQNYVIEAYPISSSWIQGTGQAMDSPINRTGVTWLHTDGQVNEWTTPGCDYLTASSSFQSHSVYSNHDLHIDVTDTISGIYTGSLTNNGFLLKINDEFEDNVSSSINIKYFGSDTNTIFPPYLEFKWDDSEYSSSLSVLSSNQNTVTIKNNREEFADSDTYRFRVAAKPKYPTRTFTTSSIYTTNHVLPQDSFFAIKDEHSEEMIINFDSNYTKISADDKSSYFDVYMDSLQPERFYRLLIKTTIDGSTVVLDDNNTFKVVRNG